MDELTGNVKGDGEDEAPVYFVPGPSEAVVHRPSVLL
jgi:hypothetical protein